MPTVDIGRWLSCLNKTKQHFASYGIPVWVYSDNDPQFDHAEYASLADTWQFMQSNRPWNQRKAYGRSLSNDETSFFDFRNTPAEGMDSTQRGPGQPCHLHNNLLEPRVDIGAQAGQDVLWRWFKRTTWVKNWSTHQNGQPSQLYSQEMERGIWVDKLAGDPIWLTCWLNSNV